jgi:hypothetical protein
MIIYVEADEQRTLCVKLEKSDFEPKDPTAREDVLDFEKFKPNLNRQNLTAKERKSFDSIRKQYTEAIFKELNGYWATLPAQSRRELFELYERVVEDYPAIPNPAERAAMLEEVVRTVVDKYHPFDAVAEFMKTQHIDYPDTVKDKFESQYNSKDRVTTYLTHEYFDLAVLAVIFRSVYPIWMKALRCNNSTDTKRKAFFEYDLLRTLRKTELIKHPATERLFEFVEAVCHKVKAHESLGSVVAGFGSADIPYYLFATAIIDKLAIREINAFADRGNLISTIYTRVESEASKLGDKFQPLRERVSRGGGADEDKIGYLETYSVRQSVSDDVYLTNQVYLYDYRKVRRQLDETIPSSLVKTCIESFHEYSPRPIRPDHVAAVQWVLGNLIMPRAIPYIDREAMINAMGLTQAALIHWRFRALAPLLSARPVETDYYAPIIATPFETPSLDLREKLREIYPYYRHTRDSSDPKALCPGFVAIGEFAKLYADRQWELHCSKKVAEHLQQDFGTFKPASTLKCDLAELLIKLNRNR